MPSFLEAFRDFMETGGIVLWAILFFAIVLWTLILERYWFYLFVVPSKIKHSVSSWENRKDKSSWHAMRIREYFISNLSCSLQRNLPVIKTVIGLCPLLGLLGTVTGMIQVFDVMAVMGTGNARAMAAGVSAATIPTMAGMVIALSGLYFNARLQHIAERKKQEAADHMLHE